MTDSLEPPDVCVVDAIPTTSVVRTLIDLAALMPRGRFEELFDSVVAGGGVRLRRLETRACELAAPRRSGCAVVLELVAETHPEVVRSRNGWEANVLRTIGRLGLPPPKVNYRVRVGGRTRYIDLAWPDHRVAVELDGFVAHLPRRIFDDDRDRQNDLVGAKWKVYRITWTAFRRDPRHAFRQVADALDVRMRVIRNGNRSK